MRFAHQILKLSAIVIAVTVMVLALNNSMAIAGDIVVVHPFARASAGPAKVGAAFLGIHNNGDTSDRLIAVHIDKSVAKKAALHRHIMEGDVAKMRKVEGGIEVPAHGMVMMEPGSLHIMLMRLQEPLKEGQNFMMTLEFEHAGKIVVEIPILGVGAKFQHDGLEHGGMEHGGMDHGNMNHNDMNMDQGEQSESN